MDLKDLLLYKEALYSQYSILSDIDQLINYVKKFFLYTIPKTSVHMLTFQFSLTRTSTVRVHAVGV